MICLSFEGLATDTAYTVVGLAASSRNWGLKAVTAVASQTLNWLVSRICAYIGKNRRRSLHPSCFFFRGCSGIRASSHMAGQVRSPLKYIISVLLSDSEYFIEKKFGLSTRVWVFVLEGPKLLSSGRTLGAKSAKSVAI